MGDFTQEGLSNLTMMQNVDATLQHLHANRPVSELCYTQSGTFDLHLFM